MARVLSGESQLMPSPRVVFGLGTATDRIAQETDALGMKRILIVTGRTLATKTELVKRVHAALGHRCVEVFPGALQHVPREAVLAGVDIARGAAIDGLVVVGGSSALDVARGIALVLAEGSDFESLQVRFSPSGEMFVPPLMKPKLPIVAIPTTLSGGEFTHGCGITNTVTLEKGIHLDPQFVPRTVLLDPDMTTETGRELWSGTAMKILSDCIEIISSRGHQPYSDALASAAASIIFRNLEASVEDRDLAARAQLQHAAFMTMGVFLVVGVGLAAAFRHQLGPMWNVPHGMASSIMIPHVMEFNRSEAPDRLAVVAQAAGVATGVSEADAGLAAVAAVANLARKMGLPTRLRDVGASRSDFDDIANHVLTDFTLQTNPRRVQEKKEVLELLERAY